MELKSVIFHLIWNGFPLVLINKLVTVSDSQNVVNWLSKIYFFYTSAVPILEANTYITTIDYSPLIGGFSITLNDGRAAYLTSSNLKFDPNQVQGIWAQHLDDATCGSINHKYRLIAFGRKK